MSEVTVYLASDLHPSEHVVLQPDFESCEFDLKAVQSELAALREDLAKQVARANDYCSKLTGTEQRFADAERRNAGLVELLTELRSSHWHGLPGPVIAKINAALKPTESGASE